MAITAGQAIAFDASGSWDPIDPSSSLQVRWDFNGDGVWDTSFSTTKTAQYTYPTSGLYTAVVQVENTRGDAERGVHLVQVMAPPPVIGGDGSVCVGDAGVTCASGYMCVATQGVCRQQCSGAGAACAVQGYTCQNDPDYPPPFNLYYVCF
jgi:hypothetical protein